MGNIPDLKELLRLQLDRRRLVPRFAKPKMCANCGVYPADPPSSLCPGCAAYREHQV